MQVYLSEHIAPSAYARLARHFEIVDNFDHPEQLAAMIIRRAAVPRSGPLPAPLPPSATTEILLRRRTVRRLPREAACAPHSREAWRRALPRRGRFLTKSLSY